MFLCVCDSAPGLFVVIKRVSLYRAGFGTRATHDKRPVHNYFCSFFFLFSQAPRTGTGAAASRGNGRRRGTKSWRGESICSVTPTPGTLGNGDWGGVPRGPRRELRRPRVRLGQHLRGEYLWQRSRTLRGGPHVPWSRAPASEVLSAQESSWGDRDQCQGPGVETRLQGQDQSFRAFVLVAR